MYAAQSDNLLSRRSDRSRENAQTVYGVGTKKSYRGQQTAGGNGPMRVVVALGIAAVTAGIVLLVAAL